MIFHFSISADDPKRTATMLAELWRGEAFYFPMVGEGSWVAHAGDDRRSTIEVYPRDLAFYPADGQAEERKEPVSRHGPFHAAVATPLSIEKSRRLAGATAATPPCAGAGRSGSLSSGSTTP
jgi:hypothetical protein